MKLSFNEVMLRLVTAINMETGDDGTKAKTIIDRLFVLLKMDKKEYKTGTGKKRQTTKKIGNV